MAPVPNPSATVRRSRKEKCPAQGHTAWSVPKPRPPKYLSSDFPIYLRCFGWCNWLVNFKDVMSHKKTHNQIEPVAKGINFKITLCFFTYSQLSEKKMEAIYARGRNNSESLGYWPTLMWDLWQWELDYKLTIILTTVRHQVSSGFGVLFPFPDLIFSSYHTLVAFLLGVLP